MMGGSFAGLAGRGENDTNKGKATAAASTLSNNVLCPLPRSFMSSAASMKR